MTYLGLKIKKKLVSTKVPINRVNKHKKKIKYTQKNTNNKKKIYI